MAQIWVNSLKPSAIFGAAIPSNTGGFSTLTTQSASMAAIAIDQSGYAWAWGFNTSGQLGDGTIITRSSPVSVVGGRSLLFTMSGANAFNIAMDNSGNLWAWGTGTSGQLGNNLAANQSSPVSIVGGKQFIPFGAIASTTVCVLDSLGYAWAWGSGTNGQLGTNQAINRSSPVSVVGGKQFSNVYGASATFVGLTQDGFVWGWGIGSGGVLGNNLVNAQSSPVSVVGGRQFTQVSFSTNLTVAALDTLGYAWAWGTGTTGQLGNGAAASQSSPVSVVGGRRWLQIVTAGTSTFALDLNSYAWAWGAGSSGQLGNNLIATQVSPVSVVGGRQFISISSGTGASVFALDSNSYAWAWGANASGQLGDGTTISRSSPVSVLGGIQWSFINSNNATATIGIQNTSSPAVAWSWGSNTNGGLGMPISNTSSPVNVKRIVAPANPLGK